jgi:hypothetical protein
MKIFGNVSQIPLKITCSQTKCSGWKDATDERTRASKIISEQRLHLSVGGGGKNSCGRSTNPPPPPSFHPSAPSKKFLTPQATRASLHISSTKVDSSLRPSYNCVSGGYVRPYLGTLLPVLNQKLGGGLGCREDGVLRGQQSL